MKKVIIIGAPQRNRASDSRYGRSADADDVPGLCWSSSADNC